MTPRRPHVDRFKKTRTMLDARLENHNKTLVDTTNVDPKENHYNFVDLFSGCGGNSLGLSMANYTPVMSVELEHDASETYRKNFPPEHHVEGDIRDVSEPQIRKIIGNKTIHMLAAGFPCQGFSTAGKRDMRDERNALYKQVVRFAKFLKPWFVVMENVPGIVSMNNGKFIDSILADFADIGYPGMSASLLESASFGVPQIRPRTIFVGNRFDVPNPYPKPLLTVDKYVSIEQAISDLKTKPRDPETNHEWTLHSEKMERRLAQVAPGRSLYDSYADANKRQYTGLPSMTIKENHGTTHIHYVLNRTLSAREMARLQSFPDSFKFYGRMKRVMWQVGNAAPPLLFKHLGLAVLPSLQQIEKTILTAVPR